MDQLAYKHQELVTHMPSGWKYKIKAPADSVSGEVPFPGSVCLYMVAGMRGSLGSLL